MWVLNGCSLQLVMASPHAMVFVKRYVAKHSLQRPHMTKFWDLVFPYGCVEQFKNHKKY